MIAEILELEQFDESNLKSLCPFHNEKTPSFIYNPKKFNYHCFGQCGRSYDIVDVLMMKKNKTYLEAVKWLFDKAGIQYGFGEMGVKTRRKYNYPTPIYGDDNEQVYEYLALRKISKETADYLNIRQDAKGNMLFQYFDTNDVLTTCKVRPSRQIKQGENKVWYLMDKNNIPYDHTPLLYNMNKINTKLPLLITSGELDCAAAIESGWYNAVSIPGGDQNTKWVEECWEWLEQFDTIIICHDNDESGNKFCNNIIPRLGSWRCKIAIVPNEVSLENGKFRAINDLNEYLYYAGKSEVMEIIINAKDTPVPSVISLSDVEQRTYSGGVRTGIKSIDQKLSRLYFGTLTIFTGQPGSGKSSFIYQMICQAMDDDIKCWIYGREIPDWSTKNWLTRTLAGNRHLNSYRSPDGDQYWKANHDAVKLIDEKYREHWYWYRDECSNDFQSLIISMTDVVRKYGVQFIVLDNLSMIDLSKESGEELEKQKALVNKLVDFAKKYQVAIMLVVHPRKLPRGASVEGMDDVSGTKTLIDLTHRAITMRRTTDIERKGGYDKYENYIEPTCRFDVEFRVFKERINGRTFAEGMYYDEPSRRFYQTPEEYDHKYGWDESVYDEVLQPPPREGQEALNECFGELPEVGENTS